MSVNDAGPGLRPRTRCSSITAPEQLRALADPLRGTLLELVLERAATVTELAQAVGRPKSTVAYHVNLLVDAGLFKVVRTRRVRAIEERYYGRVARTLYIGVLSRPRTSRSSPPSTGSRRRRPSPPRRTRPTICAACSCTPASRSRTCGASGPRSRRSPAGSPQIPRSGDQVYGFVAGLYPTDAPTLPDADPAK